MGNAEQREQDGMKYLAPLAAIGSIVLLELVALEKGFNGTLLKTSIAAIAGIGGFTLSGVWRKKKDKSE